MNTQFTTKQRSFYMMLPILVLPFVMVIFWALGGGKINTVQAQQPTSGLNVELPGAHFDKSDELWDKFALYEVAKRDSMKYEEARRSDPYYEVKILTAHNPDSIQPRNSHLNASLGDKKKYEGISEQETLINEKLEQLTRQMNQPEMLSKKIDGRSGSAATGIVPSTDNSDIDRLEKMMAVMMANDEPDRDIQQIENVLDKILTLQHPQENKPMEQVGLSNALSVMPAYTNEDVTNFQGVDIPTEQQNIDTTKSGVEVLAVTIELNGFYGIGEESAPVRMRNAMAAVVHDEQEVVNGSTIRLRLLQDVIINKQRLREGQFVYGICTINGERLTVTIHSIRENEQLLPVNLKVYDLDGIEGIFIPGAIMRDVAKQSSTQSIQDVDMFNVSNSIGAQAAGAGIEAAKNLLSKKSRLIKVTVKAGYQVFLMDSVPGR